MRVGRPRQISTGVAARVSRSTAPERAIARSADARASAPSRRTLSCPALKSSEASGIEAAVRFSRGIARRPVGVLLGITLQALLIAGSGFGLVLCRAGDGHAMIEVAHDETPCFSEIHRHHSSASASGSAHADLEQHRCTDVTLTAAMASVVVRRSISAVSSYPAAMVAFPLSSSLPDVGSLPRCNSVDRELPPDRRRVVGTTVLLI